MAHNKKQKSNAEKIDQLINLVGWLVGKINDIQSQVDTMKSAPSEQKIELQPETIAETERQLSTMDTPYKVMEVSGIIRDYGPDGMPTEIKTYMGLGKTFKNKNEAFAYAERAKQLNPGILLDVVPV